MATAKLKMYPYVILRMDGTFSHTGAFSWEAKDDLAIDHGHMRIMLAPVEIEVPLPHETQLRAGALGLLRTHRGTLQATHINTMTRLQFMENQLLGLAAPDVLDAAPEAIKPLGTPGEFGEGEDDDIPF